MKKIIVVFTFLFIVSFIKAQTCSIVVTSNNVCVGSTVSFSVTLTGGTATSYNWNFGDGFTSSSSSPNYTYLTTGTFNPTVTIGLVGVGTCIANGSPMKVFALPIAKYVITSDDTICFKDNQLCVLDQSTAGPSNAPIKKRVFQLSNGFVVVQNPPFLNNICYQNNTDLAGHLYTIVMEVTDTNNCVSRLQKTDSVRLMPKMPVIAFNQNITAQTCSSTTVNFTNTSAILQSRVKKFYWVFGDGSRDSTNWTTTSHIYTKTGSSIPKLIVIDKDGCADTALSNSGISISLPNPLIYISPRTTRCYSKNDTLHSFNFASSNPAATVIWLFTNVSTGKVVYQDSTSFPNSISNFRFPSCGMFHIKTTIKYPSCTLVSDTDVIVQGPKAVIETDTIKAKNRTQCLITDTVFYISPVPYQSCLYGNSATQYLWNFNDAYAPACTTDTKNNVNVGLNCNFSKDSIRVNHWYTPGKEKCYLTSLTIKDTVTGCNHKDSTYISLAPPDASPDTLVPHVRKGLYYKGVSCLNNPITFFLDQTLPDCGYQKAWMVFDSACDSRAWIMIDSLNKRIYSYVYNKTCDSSGFITVGLILKNGNCYDTAWYHKFLLLKPMEPAFSYKINTGCRPSIVEFIPKDTIQTGLKKVKWVVYFLDQNLTGSYVFVDSFSQFFLPKDSIILKPKFILKDNGIYQISVLYEDTFGCTAFDLKDIGLGYYQEFGSARVNLCLGDSETIIEKVRYYDTKSFDLLNPTAYWNNPVRNAANKERIWWDIGDGKGFFYQGAGVTAKYNKPGKYTVKMMTQDSLGCRDTLVKKDYFTIFEVTAAIATLGDVYYCAPQIVIFKDSSYVLDSLNSPIVSTQDSVINWLWEFDDNKPSSILRNPSHNFSSNGKFKTLLTVTTSLGCKDTVSAIIDIKGPTPKFEMQDTVGCSPFTLLLKNTTGYQLKGWTWYFGDASSQILSTDKDTAVTFTYTQPGTYNIRLLGIDNILNPNTGNQITCNSFYPDPVTLLPKRTLTVLPTPAMDIFAEDTICPLSETVFTAIYDSVYNLFNWNFGDGQTFSSSYPDTFALHSYLAVGSYTVQLIPGVSAGYDCIDTAYKTIVVRGPKAEFDIDASQAPLYNFTNKSIGATRYEWNFGKPSAGSSNTATTLNASYNYGGDTGVSIICLTAFNQDDCWDSICKPTNPQARISWPNVFTPDNNDGKNDAFDIDIMGYTYFELQIFNRWGREVFYSLKDGFGNDGTNWNGKDKNDGEPCAAGVYYFILKYKLITEEKQKAVHGTVTLLR